VTRSRGTSGASFARLVSAMAMRPRLPFDTHLLPTYLSAFISEVVSRIECENSTENPEKGLHICSYGREAKDCLSPLAINSRPRKHKEDRFIREGNRSCPHVEESLASKRSLAPSDG
jgi:hypothetical protein